MESGTAEEKFFAVCVGKGRLARVGNADEVQYREDEVDRPLRIGQWVVLEANMGEITRITEIADYVPTEVRNGVLFLDVKVEFREAPADCALQLARCSELSEEIFVPEKLDVSVFNMNEEYEMIITLATESEIGFYKYSTGCESRWKLHIPDCDEEDGFEEVQRPPRKRTDYGEGGLSGVVRRTGIVVGISASGKTHFVYTPEEPVGKDGRLYAGYGEPVELGDWIKFDVDAEEAQRIFVHKVKEQFDVLEYRKTDALLPTVVNNKKGSIELTLENFDLCHECRSVSVRGAPMIRHRELGLIADTEKVLKKYSNVCRLDIQIARTRQVSMHDTIWGVIHAKPHKPSNRSIAPKTAFPTAPPLKSIVAMPPVDGMHADDDNEEANGVEMPCNTSYAATARENAHAPLPAPVAALFNHQTPHTRKGRDAKRTPRSRRNHDNNNNNNNYDDGKSRNRNNAKQDTPRRYRCFVTGISPIKVYLWVADEANPRRATMYTGGKTSNLKVGQWLEGDFIRQYIVYEKRYQFVCLHGTWEMVEEPADVDTKRSRDDDGFQMVVARLNASYSMEKNCLMNKVVGEILDPRCLIPRDAIDREIFGAVITLTRRADSSHYDWTIERLETAAPIEPFCRGNVEKKIVDMLEKMKTRDDDDSLNQNSQISMKGGREFYSNKYKNNRPF